MIGRFVTYPHGLKIKEEQRMKERLKYSNYNDNNSPSRIEWIDSILQIPIDDGRKRVTNLILAPYLCNIRKLSYQECYNIIKDWLVSCSNSWRLDFSIDRFVKLALYKTVGFKPMRLDTLKDKYQDIYSKLLPKTSIIV